MKCLRSVRNKFQDCTRCYYFELPLEGRNVTPDCALLGAAEQHHINVQHTLALSSKYVLWLSPAIITSKFQIGVFSEYFTHDLYTVPSITTELCLKQFQLLLASLLRSASCQCCSSSRSRLLSQTAPEIARVYRDNERDDTVEFNLAIW